MAIGLILFYISIFLSSLLLFYMRRRLNYWKDHGIPHDSPHFLQGNMQGLMRTRSFAQIFDETYKKFKGTGPFCGFYLFQRPSVVLLDINLIKNVLIKDFSNFVDRGLFHNEKDDPLTGHLFLLDGQKWRSLRNKLSPTFTSGKMKFMFPTVIKVAEQFAAVLRQMTDQSQIVEIKELLARFTTDVIGTCAFGIECNSLTDPNAEFRIMGRRSLTERRHNAFISGFIQSFPDLARKLHMRSIPNDVNDFFLRIVRESVQYREEQQIRRNDFLDLLIELKNNKDESASLTVEEMAAQAFVFFLGGFETSSTTMSFALYELAQNTVLQQRLRDDILETLQKHNNVLSYESLKEMHYLSQVISETLRKYSIVPHLNRQALNDYIVPGYKNYVIKKGMPVIIPAYGIHHDAEFYPEPEVFDPERFSKQKIQQRDSVEWLPFGDGPRNCIGMRFGLMQTRIGLAYLLKNFTFSKCAETEMPPLEMDPRSFVVNSKNGIFLQVQAIKN